MFSYYGSKSKIVGYYPPPKHKRIIEPFAGSARYSLKYWQNDVLLVDKYDVIVKIWNWLKTASVNDVLKIPEPKIRERININDFDCEEQFLLMSFVIKSGSATPSTKVCSNRGQEGQISSILKTISNNLFKIRHWNIILDDYRNLENTESTWFIDPPYQFGGEHYKESSKKLNFIELAEWCKSRNGQTIVCENTKADWLPFKPMVDMQGVMFKTTEAIWSNHQTNYDAVQQSLQF